jgi:hypothetical protein
MIHDTRNAIQHRGATISQLEAEFYISTSYNFMKRFLKDELNLELHALLEEKYYKIFNVIQVPDIREVISISDRIDATVVYRNPIWIIQAYVVLEKQLWGIEQYFVWSQRKNSTVCYAGIW